MRNTQTRITLDIETIPDLREGAEQSALSRIKAPGNYRDQAKIDAYIAEKGAEAWRSTALDGSYGQLFCIGFALGNEEPVVLARSDIDDPTPEDEFDLLDGFWGYVDESLTDAPTWIGHNILKFDLRFLWQRSVILGVPMRRRLPYDVSPFSTEVADTMTMWSGERTGGPSLDNLLDILRIPNPDPIKGSEVWDHVERHEYKTVIEHCYQNVVGTREAWRRMALLPGTTRS